MPTGGRQLHGAYPLLAYFARWFLMCRTLLSIGKFDKDSHRCFDMVLIRWERFVRVYGLVPQMKRI